MTFFLACCLVGPQRAAQAQNVSPVLIFLYFFPDPENDRDLNSGAEGLETEGHEFGEMDTSSELSFGKIPTCLRTP